ncbi:hypothetical protein BDR07DRAFT_729315 [Suillus spraguei]|nr:hypothetical protein BDR07DRAFT_729315 [Suillus spraguei]
MLSPLPYHFNQIMSLQYDIKLGPRGTRIAMIVMWALQDRPINRDITSCHTQSPLTTGSPNLKCLERARTKLRVLMKHLDFHKPTSCLRTQKSCIGQLTPRTKLCLSYITTCHPLFLHQVKCFGN